MGAGFAPVELYQFFRGTQSWYYTSADHEVTVAAQLYTPAELSVSRVSASHEQARNNIEIYAPVEFPVAQIYRSGVPAVRTTFNYLMYNVGGLGAASLLWSGFLGGAEWGLDSSDGGDDSLTMHGLPISSLLGRNAVFRRFSKNCPFALYEPHTCKASKAGVSHATTVSTISGRIVTVGSVGSYNYTGGMITWNAGTHTESRWIQSYTGSDLVLFTPPIGLSVSQAVTIYPGCDRTIAVCDSVFSNALNYGGWPYKKKANIFQGHAIDRESVGGSVAPTLPYIPVVTV